MTRFQATIVTAVNNDQILADNLMKSPMITSGLFPVIIEKGHANAGKAYNAGLAKATGDYIIFAHQDVYFPTGWETKLFNAITQLEKTKQPWAVLGIWGVQESGRFVGKVWCTGGNQEHAAQQSALAPVASIDEIVIVLKRESGLKFDEQLPGYHLYATDIILQAKSKGFGAFAFTAPVVHNSRSNPNPLDHWYRAAYHYMQKKWNSLIPIRTCVVPVTRWGWPMYKRWLKNEVRRRRRPQQPQRPRQDSLEIARRLGYEPTLAATAATPQKSGQS